MTATGCGFLAAFCRELRRYAAESFGIMLPKASALCCRELRHYAAESFGRKEVATGCGVSWHEGPSGCGGGRQRVSENFSVMPKSEFVTG